MMSNPAGRRFLRSAILALVTVVPGALAGATEPASDGVRELAAGSAAQATGARADAIAHLRRAVARLDPERECPQLAEAYLRLGEAYLAAEKPQAEEALSALVASAALASEPQTAYLWAAAAAEDLGRAADAASYKTRAMAPARSAGGCATVGVSRPAVPAVATAVAPVALPATAPATTPAPAPSTPSAAQPGEAFHYFFGKSDTAPRAEPPAPVPPPSTGQGLPPAPPAPPVPAPPASSATAPPASGSPAKPATRPKAPAAKAGEAFNFFFAKKPPVDQDQKPKDATKDQDGSAPPPL